MVPGGRVLFALVQRWFSTRVTYHSLPFLLAIVLVLIALLPHDGSAAGVLAFALAGLGCSALMPLTISFAQEQLTAMSTAVAGGMIASYQVGYGVAAFGAGPLQQVGIGLPIIFGFTAIAAAGMGGLSMLLVGRRPLPSHLHPRP
jgi:predicted MFS family arabinose efflux permease